MVYFPLENVNKNGFFEILSPQSILLDASFPRMKSANNNYFDIFWQKYVFPA